MRSVSALRRPHLPNRKVTDLNWPGILAPSASTVPQLVHDALSEYNGNYLKESLYGRIDKPVVRILRRGTFGEYREWKARKDNIAAGQIKVPAVVYNPEILQFLDERVIQEFSA